MTNFTTAEQPVRFRTLDGDVFPVYAATASLMPPQAWERSRAVAIGRVDCASQSKRTVSLHLCLRFHVGVESSRELLRCSHRRVGRVSHASGIAGCCAHRVLCSALLARGRVRAHSHLCTDFLCRCFVPQSDCEWVGGDSTTLTKTAYDFRAVNDYAPLLLDLTFSPDNSTTVNTIMNLSVVITNDKVCKTVILSPRCLVWCCVVLRAIRVAMPCSAVLCYALLCCVPRSLSLRRTNVIALVHADRGGARRDVPHAAVLTGRGAELHRRPVDPRAHHRRWRRRRRHPRLLREAVWRGVAGARRAVRLRCGAGRQRQLRYRGIAGTRRRWCRDCRPC
jgi:hypothetical protein